MPTLRRDDVRATPDIRDTGCGGDPEKDYLAYEPRRQSLFGVALILVAIKTTGSIYSWITGGATPIVHFVWREERERSRFMKNDEFSMSISHLTPTGPATNWTGFGFWIRLSELLRFQFRFSFVRTYGSYLAVRLSVPH